MSKTLKEAHDEIIYFVEEAEKCLAIGCGYSAMSTIFSVILTVSEAVLGKEPKGKRYLEDTLINNFFSHMSDKDWFLPKNTKAPSDDEIKRYLYEIRNGLSHQISLPEEIGLITTKTDIKYFSGMDVLYFISVEDFISSVKSTIEKLLIEEKYASTKMDPNFGSFKLSPREIGSRTVETDTEGTIIAASAVGSKIAKNE
jgi:hypothetical protein